MSISDTNAKARAAGMTYGQYCDARDRGLLSDDTEEKDTPALSPAPAVHSVQKKIKWTVELKNDLRRLCEDGLSLEEISERLGIDQSKIRTQLGHMKYREGYTPPSHRAPAKQKKTAQIPKKEVITEAVSDLGKHTIFDSTDPMCILDFIKGIVLESFSPDEITAIYAAREDCIAEMQYKIGEDLWRIQVRKE